MLPDLIKILGLREFGWDRAPFSSTQTGVNTWKRTRATDCFGIPNYLRYLPLFVESCHFYIFYMPKITEEFNIHQVKTYITFILKM